MSELLKIFLTFFKIGFIAFGGGYAVAPLLQKECVEHRKWITNEELTDIMAIAQTLPGIIFTNCATMIGYRVSGFFGALIATASAITPTFVITILVTTFFWKYTENPIIQKAFTGILIGVSALIIYAISKMWKSSVKNYFDIFLVLFSATCLILFKLSGVYVILGISVIGFFRNLIVQNSRREKS